MTRAQAYSRRLTKGSKEKTCPTKNILLDARGFSRRSTSPKAIARAGSDFVVRVHAPFPHICCERDWAVIDVDSGDVIFQQQMILPEPKGWTGAPFAIDVWSRQRYAGDGLWNLKHDVTLSSARADANFRAWMSAGGRFAAPPLAPPAAVAMGE